MTILQKVTENPGRKTEKSQRKGREVTEAVAAALNLRKAADPGQGNVRRRKRSISINKRNLKNRRKSRRRGPGPAANLTNLRKIMNIKKI